MFSVRALLYPYPQEFELHAVFPENLSSPVPIFAQTLVTTILVEVGAVDSVIQLWAVNWSSDSHALSSFLFSIPVLPLCLFFLDIGLDPAFF